MTDPDVPDISAPSGSLEPQPGKPETTDSTTVDVSVEKTQKTAVDSRAKRIENQAQKRGSRAEKRRQARRDKKKERDAESAEKKKILFVTEDHSNPDFWGFIGREMVSNFKYRLPFSPTWNSTQKDFAKDSVRYLPGMLERYDAISKTAPEYLNASTPDTYLALDRIKGFVFSVWTFDQLLPEEDRILCDKDMRRFHAAVNSLKWTLINTKDSSETLRKAEKLRKDKLLMRNVRRKEVATAAVDSKLDAVDMIHDYSEAEMIDILGEMIKILQTRLAQREAHSEIIRKNIKELRNENQSLVDTVVRLKKKHVNQAAADRWLELRKKRREEKKKEEKE